MWFDLIFTSILIGIGLAMDAFSVSLANGLNYPKMQLKKVFTISGVFALFQGMMPLIGWFAIAGFLDIFEQLKPFAEKCIPWVAFILLCFIGGKMLYESLHHEKESKKAKTLTAGALLLQAVATSIDALTEGISLAKDFPRLSDYGYILIAVGIIAVLTFGICFAGVKIGQKMGTKLSNKAGILGGAVLIFLGLKIFVVDILFGHA